MVGELARHLGHRRVRVDGRLLGVHQPVHRRLGVGDQQLREGHATLVLAAPVHHVQVVRVLRQLAAQAQVAQHHVHRDIGAHRDQVGIHQAAGRILLVAEHVFQALAVLALHGPQHLVDDRLRQVLQQFGQVVDVQAFRCRDDFVRVHVAQEVLAHLLADVHQHLAVVLGIDQAPHDAAPRRRQRLQQVADLRRRQRVHQALDRPQPPRVQRLVEQAQLLGGLVVAGGVGHARLPGRRADYPRWGASRLPFR